MSVFPPLIANLLCSLLFFCVMESLGGLTSPRDTKVVAYGFYGEVSQRFGGRIDVLFISEEPSLLRFSSSECQRNILRDQFPYALTLTIQSLTFGDVRSSGSFPRFS